MTDTDMSLCAATPMLYNLMGIYDEVSILYDQIMMIIDDTVYAHYDAENGRLRMSAFGKIDKCRPAIKKQLNKFFERNYRLFTGTEQHLYVNDRVMATYSFAWFENSNKSPLAIKYKHMSFSRFCAALETIAASLIYYRREREDPSTTEQDVFEEVNNRLLRSSSEIWKERKTQLDDMASEAYCPQLYIFKALSQVTCYKEHHVVPDDCVVLLSGKSRKAVRLPIHRCETCGRRFIGIESYKLFTEEYGILIFERCPDESMIKDSFFMYNSESKLHQMGYNVIDGKLSEKERQSILTTLLDNKIMTYLEICRDIENAIGIFQGRAKFQAAVNKWKLDLGFIGNYVLKKACD